MEKWVLKIFEKEGHVVFSLHAIADDLCPQALLLEEFEWGFLGEFVHFLNDWHHGLRIFVHLLDVTTRILKFSFEFSSPKFLLFF